MARSGRGLICGAVVAGVNTTQIVSQGNRYLGRDLKSGLFEYRAGIRIT